MRELGVYSRRGCHLCEDLLAELEPLCRGRASVTVRDIDTRDDWASAYSDAVPVLCSDNQEICRFHLDRDAVVKLLAADG